MKFIEACIGDSCEIPALMAVWLGIRRSEIIGLNWESIDFKGRCIKIENAVVPNKDNKFVSKKETKTKKSRRTIRCPWYIMNKLEVYKRDKTEALQKENPDAELAGRVFTIGAETLRRHVKAICKKAGITEVGVHGLRHTNASVMLSLRIADRIAMERGGWSNEVTMKRIYQHVFKDDRSAADEAIDTYFESLVESVVSHELSHDISE